MPVLTSPLTLHLTCLPPNIRFDKSYWRPASADTVRDKVRICNYWSIMGMFINPPPASPWLWAPLLHDRFRSVPSTYAFSSAEALNVAASVCMPLNSTLRIIGLGQSAREAAGEAKMADFLLAAIFHCQSVSMWRHSGDP